MRLLLDAMYAPAIAEQLRQRGHDVVAARARDDLADLSDPDLLAAVLAEQRVIVTENVIDFMVLDAEFRRAGRDHAGIIMATARRYPRRRGAGIGQLVMALDAWLRERADEAIASSMIWWL